MEKSRVFCGVLVLVAVLALLFQGIGLFSPAWMKISVGVDMKAMSEASAKQDQGQGGTFGQPQNTRGKRDEDGSTGKSWDFSGFGQSGSNGQTGSNDKSSEPETGFLEPKEDSHDASSSDAFSDLGNAMSQAVGNMKTEMTFGLFTASTCVDMAGVTKCIDYDQMKEEMNKQAEHAGSPTNIANISFDKVFGELHKCAVLASLGFVAAIAGCVLTFILLRAENSHKVKGIICASLWGISVVFVLAAVSMQVQQNANMQNGFDIIKAIPMTEGINLDMPCPWALLMSGMGCLFAAVGGVMVAVAVCYMPAQTESWSRFHNQAV